MSSVSATPAGSAGVDDAGAWRPDSPLSGCLRRRVAARRECQVDEGGEPAQERLVSSLFGHPEPWARVSTAVIALLQCGPVAADVASAV
jgi:hypothetical protein